MSVSDVRMSVCLIVRPSVCQLAYLKNNMLEIHEISCTCYPGPWLDRYPTTMESTFVDDVMFPIIGPMARCVGNMNVDTVVKIISNVFTRGRHSV